jgi:hypothetical protein
MRRCICGAGEHSEPAADPRGSIRPEPDSAQVTGSGYLAGVEKPRGRIEVGPGFSCPEGGSATSQASANGPVNLTATAYLAEVALSPQPEFAWESDNPAAARVGQTGAVTRAVGNVSFFASGSWRNLPIRLIDSAEGSWSTWLSFVRLR